MKSPTEYIPSIKRRMVYQRIATLPTSSNYKPQGQPTAEKLKHHFDSAHEDILRTKYHNLFSQDSSEPVSTMKFVDVVPKTKLASVRREVQQRKKVRSSTVSQVKILQEAGVGSRLGLVDKYTTDFLNYKRNQMQSQPESATEATTSSIEASLNQQNKIDAMFKNDVELDADEDIDAAFSKLKQNTCNTQDNLNTEIDSPNSELPGKRLKRTNDALDFSYQAEEEPVFDVYRAIYVDDFGNQVDEHGADLEKNLNLDGISSQYNPTHVSVLSHEELCYLYDEWDETVSFLQSEHDKYYLAMNGSSGSHQVGTWKHTAASDAEDGASQDELEIDYPDTESESDDAESDEKYRQRGYPRGLSDDSGDEHDDNQYNSSEDLSDEFDIYSKKSRAINISDSENEEDFNGDPYDSFGIHRSGRQKQRALKEQVSQLYGIQLGGMVDDEISKQKVKHVNFDDSDDFSGDSEDEVYGGSNGFAKFLRGKTN